MPGFGTVAPVTPRSKWLPVSDIRPDPDHDAVLGSEARHLVVTAPPGTGKTLLSVRLAQKLVTTLPSEGRVLLLTFSNQARTQLEREAARLLSGELRRRVAITNYHRLFWYGVLAFRRALGLPMQLDIGSRRRRADAFRRTDEELLSQLASEAGLLESLAEHAFAEFRDERTLSEASLERALAVVEREQRAGRLVFDDLGALFWTLLERFPVVDQAYRSRFPAVIADEHQDASALQDAVVRRLGGDRMVVFADPMQLIHEFRGASRERLERHLSDCDEKLTLGTAHRWHGSEQLAHWLLAVRDRLQGHPSTYPAPPQLRLEYAPVRYGFNGMNPFTKRAVARAFDCGARTVAVLARGNEQVAELRSYLSRQGQYPRQIGTEDFEDAREDIEQLPLFRDPQTVARQAVDRLDALVPTLSASVLGQVRDRLLADEINLSRAGSEAKSILRALEPIYGEGPGAYFESVVAALEACAGAGHHLPRKEAVRALRATALTLTDEPADLDLALKRYSAAVMDAAHASPREEQGLFVMTAHQAKGKEFDGVILADAMERYWPDNDETRRLFYVVITRASRFWSVIALDDAPSPLIEYLSADN